VLELYPAAREVMLAWNALPDARTYRIYYRRHGRPDWTLLDEIAAAPLPQYTVGHDSLGDGYFEFAVSAVYDESGQLLTGSFMDYAMPHAADMPSMQVSTIEVPCKNNPMGVKGCGEAGSVASPAAVINALIDALKPLGVNDIDMPATPARVWETITRAQKGGGARA